MAAKKKKKKKANAGLLDELGEAMRKPRASTPARAKKPPPAANEGAKKAADAPSPANIARKTSISLHPDDQARLDTLDMAARRLGYRLNVSQLVKLGLCLADADSPNMTEAVREVLKQDSRRKR